MFKRSPRYSLSMRTQVDDVGSFPLSATVNRAVFDEAYRRAREAYTSGRDPRKDPFVLKNFCDVTIDAFKQKYSSGLDVVNYPQQYDGIRQVSDVIHLAMEKGTFLVDSQHAILPEVCLIRDEARRLSEELGQKIKLRVSLFGPMEQYLREMGTVVYDDVLKEYAETIRRFANHSVLNLEHIKTEVVSIDEPSFGFLDLGAPKETILSVLERAFDIRGALRQIHIHSPSRLLDLLEVKNIDVLSFEYAASPRNIETVTRKMLDNANKRIRVGTARTDIDSIMAELHAAGVASPSIEHLVENVETIRRRFNIVKEKYGDTLSFTGPDCGLGSWPSQEAAVLLLRRSVSAVKSV